jgi:hypothetical protein
VAMPRHMSARCALLGILFALGFVECFAGSLGLPVRHSYKRTSQESGSVPESSSPVVPQAPRPSLGLVRSFVNPAEKGSWETSKQVAPSHLDWASSLASRKTPVENESMHL